MNNTLDNNKSVADYSDQTIFSIENVDGKKIIHFYGYGYWVDGDKANPCRFLEYTFFYAPLYEVLNYGVIDYETEYAGDIKTYITDCNEIEMSDFYKHYDNGKMPKLIKESEITMSTPCGTYILI